MVIEISIILAYLAGIFIKNSQLGYSPFGAVFLLIDFSILIQAAVLSAIFFGIKSIREMYKNERLKARILFLMAAILISVVNAMISVDGKADIWTYFLLTSSFGAFTGAVNSVLPAVFVAFTNKFKDFYPRYYMTKKA